MEVSLQFADHRLLLTSPIGQVRGALASHTGGVGGSSVVWLSHHVNRFLGIPSNDPFWDDPHLPLLASDRVGRGIGCKRGRSVRGSFARTPPNIHRSPLPSRGTEEAGVLYLTTRLHACFFPVAAGADSYKLALSIGTVRTARIQTCLNEPVRNGRWMKADRHALDRNSSLTSISIRPSLFLPVPLRPAPPVVVVRRVLDQLLVAGCQQLLPQHRVRLELPAYRHPHHVVLHLLPVAADRVLAAERKPVAYVRRTRLRLDGPFHR